MSWVVIVAGALIFGVVANRLVRRSRFQAHLVGTGVTAVIGIGFAIWDLKQGTTGPLLDELSDGPLCVTAKAPCFWDLP